MWCTDQSTAAFPMCLQKTLALLLHWRKRCCCILMYYIESIFACIIMTLNGHIFISWEAQSSWKRAGCFSCSFFPPRVLETFWGRVFLLPHLLPDVCQVVRRPQSLPPLQRRFLALPCCCWLPVSGEAAKTTNKTHQQTDTVMFVWLQPRLWHSHKNKVALFIMRMMMVTSVNICRDSRTKQRTHKDSDVTLDKCNDEMMSETERCVMTVDERETPEWTRSPNMQGLQQQHPGWRLGPVLPVWNTCWFIFLCGAFY